MHRILVIDHDSRAAETTKLYPVYDALQPLGRFSSLAELVTRIIGWDYLFPALPALVATRFGAGYKRAGDRRGD